MERVLGFDVGERRIGLALSDELGYTAQPLFTLHRTSGRNGLRDDLKSIARVVRRLPARRPLRIRFAPS